MRASVTLLFLSSVTGTIATCFNEQDTSWLTDTNRGMARNAVRDLCRVGALSGWFPNPGHTKTACAPLSNGIRANLAVSWVGPSGGYTLAASDCELRLNNEVDGCWHGGQSTKYDWYFKADPNYGGC